MLRWMVPFLVAIAAGQAAVAAEQAPPRAPAPRTVHILPAGLPRPHYHYRTTIAAPYPAPRVYVQAPVVEEAPLISPDPVGGYIANLPGTPLLPGSSTIPGYYGRPFDYDYQGAYYGGPQVGYWWRLPYACGVYGYC
jgi:hypothetical protein